MKKFWKIIIFTAVACGLAGCFDDEYSLNTGGVRAYPVPFNPKSGNRLLTVDLSALNITSECSIKLTVYDVGGDKVFSRDFDMPGSSSPLTVSWNGRSDEGKTVGAGIYYVTVSVEIIDTGDYGEKILRVPVVY